MLHTILGQFHKTNILAKYSSPIYPVISLRSSHQEYFKIQHAFLFLILAAYPSHPYHPNFVILAKDLMIKSRRMRWAGHVARMGEKRTAYRILVVNPEGKRSLGRQRRRWVDNIKMDLRERGCDGMDWIDLVQDRGQCRALVNAVMNLPVP
jgi:hypothetical protein